MDLLISSLVGGLIGYFTNWLAIKMLFRPYEKKYILGLKLPFTPGLIPKEKDRIAQNIGQTVEDYLLSPQLILKSLEKEEDGLEEILLEKIQKLEDKDYRLGQLFEKLGPSQEARLELEEKIRLQASGLIRELDLPDLVLDFIREKISTRGERDKISQALLEEYTRQLSSPASRQELESRIKDLLARSRQNKNEVRSYLSQGLISDMEAYIDKNHKLLAYRLGQVLAEKNMETRIRSVIRNLIQANLGGLLGSLIPMDLVEEKTYQALVNYMASPEGARDLQGLLRSGLDNLLDTSLGDLMDGLDNTIDEKLISQRLIELLVSEKAQAWLVQILEGQLEKIDLDQLGLFLDQQIDKFLASDQLWEKIFKLADQALEGLGNIRINTLMAGLDLDGPRIYRGLRDIFGKFMRQDGERLIKSLGLAKIVEETILGFDSRFTEELILDIANKELRAITILGGFLGALIGVLNPLIQKLLA